MEVVKLKQNIFIKHISETHIILHNKDTELKFDITNKQDIEIISLLSSEKPFIIDYFLNFEADKLNIEPEPQPSAKREGSPPDDTEIRNLFEKLIKLDFLTDLTNTDIYTLPEKDLLNDRHAFYDATADEWEDKEYCLEAITNGKYNAFRLVPNKFWSDPNFCFEAVKRTSEALEWIDEKILTEEMILTAIKQNGFAIQDVPKRLMKKIYVETAVRQNKDAISRVPEEWREEAIEAIKKKRSEK